MPFEPLTPSEEKDLWPEPCRSPEHDPPGMIVITKPCRWVCPACGASVMLFPSSPKWCDDSPRSRQWRMQCRSVLAKGEGK